MILRDWLVSRLETLQSTGRAAVGPMSAAIRELAPWFHNLHLSDGTETAPDHPLGDFPAAKWREIEARLPFSLARKRVLDVGCNAGYHAFRMSELGARVVAMELDEHYLRQARWATEHVSGGAEVELRHASVYDLWDGGTQFDVINFMGVFYHLRYPLLALDILAAVCTRWMIFQSLSLTQGAGGSPPPHGKPENLDISDMTALAEPDWPRLAFVENRLAGDPSNWWVPNEPAVFALLRSAGFEVRCQLGAETWLAERVAEATGPRLGFSI